MSGFLELAAAIAQVQTVFEGGRLVGEFAASRHDIQIGLTVGVGIEEGGAEVL